MPVLHNRISNDELKAKMLAESEPRTTILYKYFTIASCRNRRGRVKCGVVYAGVDVLVAFTPHMKASSRNRSVPQSKVETFRQQLYTFDPALDGLRF